MSKELIIELENPRQRECALAYLQVANHAIASAYHLVGQTHEFDLDDLVGKQYAENAVINALARVHEMQKAATQQEPS